jgi:hypothetical protein
MAGKGQEETTPRERQASVKAARPYAFFRRKVRAMPSFRVRGSRRQVGKQSVGA